MRILLTLSGIIAGAAIAWALNKFIPNKLENKSQRIGLQVAAYVVFILLGFAFMSIFSLRIVLDKFITGRLQIIEINLSRMFPNSNILETNFDTDGLVSINNQIQRSINDIKTNNDSYFEKLVYDAFITKLSYYTNAVDSGVITLAQMSNADGTITLKTILYNLKDIALNTVSPYFKVLQILILILFFVFIGIYFGIILYIKKGGALYNKSIVYGE